MQKVATMVLDINDDDGALLKELFSFDALPEQIKTANLTTEHDDWALVLNVEGTEFKKYACNDPGNTAISLVYFLNNYDKLPDEAVKIATVSLLDSMGRFKMYVPPELKAIAKECEKYGPTYTRSKWESRDNLYNMDTPAAGHKIAAETVVKSAKYKLLDKYPIDTFEQVKLAMTYFDNYWTECTPEERREYCVGLEKRANDLLTVVSPNVSNWAGSEYGDRFEGFIDKRRRYVSQDEGKTLDLLLEKRAFVSPDTFAEALKEFDLVNGLDSRWNELNDPYYVTFSKTAKEHWYYHTDEARIYEKDLHDLAMRTDMLNKQFSKEFAMKFISSPKSTFNEASEPVKKLLTRMCRDKLVRY